LPSLSHAVGDGSLRADRDDAALRGFAEIGDADAIETRAARRASIDEPRARRDRVSVCATPLLPDF